MFDDPYAGMFGMLQGGVFGGGGSPSAFSQACSTQRRMLDELSMAQQRYYEDEMRVHMLATYGMQAERVRVPHAAPDIDKMPLLEYLRARKREWLV